MILRSYHSLGLFPAIITMMIVTAVVLTLGLVLIRVGNGNVVVLVPKVADIGEAKPGVPDDEYAKAFTSEFLQQWLTWNDLNCRYRLSKAIDLMVPSVQEEFLRRAAIDAKSANVMAQSQSFSIRNMNIEKIGSVYQVKISGELKVFYGGIGGVPDSYQAILLLQPMIPTINRPVALEVAGFIEKRT